MNIFGFNYFTVAYLSTAYPTDRYICPPGIGAYLHVRIIFDMNKFSKLKEYLQ